MAPDLRKRVTAEVTSVNDGLKTAPTLTNRQISHQSASTTRALLAVPPGTTPTPGASPADFPVLHSVPVYDRTEWLWEYAGRTPAKGLDNTSGFIHAAHGWKEHYDKQLGWVALKPAPTAPFYVLSAHPAFKTVPVLVGWGSPDANAGFVGSDNGVSYRPVLNPVATEASRRGPHSCKTSTAEQAYDTNILAPLPIKANTFIYRETVSARWCWDDTNRHAAWDNKFEEVSPVYIGKYAQAAGTYEKSHSWDGPTPFTWNGSYQGGAYMKASYHLANGGPADILPVDLAQASDTLAIAGTYDHGHWYRCSTSNSGLRRVGGPNENTVCALIRGSRH